MINEWLNKLYKVLGNDSNRKNPHQTRRRDIKYKGRTKVRGINKSKRKMRKKCKGKR